jgi:hypothetical protein
MTAYVMHCDHEGEATQRPAKIEMLVLERSRILLLSCTWSPLSPKFIWPKNVMYPILAQLC